MITKEQFVNSILTYADREVLPVLSTAGKWGVGTIIALLRDRGEVVIDELIQSPMVKALGVVTADGLINQDILMNSLRTSAERYGKLQISMPIIGTLTFSCDDVDKMRNYMSGVM